MTTLAALSCARGEGVQVIGGIALEKLSPADFDTCYATLLRQGGVAKKANPDGSRDPRPLSPRSVLHCHRVMHAAMERARKWKMISENPVEGCVATVAGADHAESVHIG